MREYIITIYNDIDKEMYVYKIAARDILIAERIAITEHQGYISRVTARKA
jgi:hypothetical protein